MQQKLKLITHWAQKTQADKPHTQTSYTPILAAQIFENHFLKKSEQNK